MGKNKRMADEISTRVFLNAIYNCAKYSSLLNIVYRNAKLCGLVEIYRNVGVKKIFSSY